MYLLFKINAFILFIFESFKDRNSEPTEDVCYQQENIMFSFVLICFIVLIDLHSFVNNQLVEFKITNTF